MAINEVTHLRKDIPYTVIYAALQGLLGKKMDVADVKAPMNQNDPLWLYISQDSYLFSEIYSLKDVYLRDGVMALWVSSELDEHVKGMPLNDVRDCVERFLYAFGKTGDQIRSIEAAKGIIELDEVVPAPAESKVMHLEVNPGARGSFKPFCIHVDINEFEHHFVMGTKKMGENVITDALFKFWLDAERLCDGVKMSLYDSLQSYLGDGAVFGSKMFPLSKSEWVYSLRMADAPDAPAVQGDLFAGF